MQMPHLWICARNQPNFLQCVIKRSRLPTDQIIRLAGSLSNHRKTLMAFSGKTGDWKSGIIQILDLLPGIKLQFVRWDSLFELWAPSFETSISS